MNSGNGFADYYESLHQIKCAQEDAFESWYDENQNTLREDFSATLTDEEEFDDAEFMEWAKEQFERETK